MGRAGDRFPLAAILTEDAGFQERLHQAQDTLVSDPVSHPAHQGGVVDLVERVGDTLPTSATCRRRRRSSAGGTRSKVMRLAVFGWMRKHGQLELCLVLPDGSKSLIPAAWTDLDGDAEPAGTAETLGSLADFLHARAVVDGLIHRAEAAQREGCGEADRGGPACSRSCRWTG